MDGRTTRYILLGNLYRTPHMSKGMWSLRSYVFAVLGCVLLLDSSRLAVGQGDLSAPTHKPWRWCYVCSGSQPDQECERFPNYVADGRQNCTRQYCTSTVRYTARRGSEQTQAESFQRQTPEDFEISSVQRDCEDRPRGNRCVRDSPGVDQESVTCYTTCMGDYCNGENRTPTWSELGRPTSHNVTFKSRRRPVLPPFDLTQFLKPPIAPPPPSSDYDENPAMASDSSAPSSPRLPLRINGMRGRYRPQQQVDWPVVGFRSDELSNQIPTFRRLPRNRVSFMPNFYPGAGMFTQRAEPYGNDIVNNGPGDTALSMRPMNPPLRPMDYQRRPPVRVAATPNLVLPPFARFTPFPGYGRMTTVGMRPRFFRPMVQTRVNTDFDVVTESFNTMGDNRGNDRDYIEEEPTAIPARFAEEKSPEATESTMSDDVTEETKPPKRVKPEVDKESPTRRPGPNGRRRGVKGTPYASVRSKPASSAGTVHPLPCSTMALLIAFSVATLGFTRG